jgi:hypothetical protein
VSLRFTLLRHLPAPVVRGYVLDRLARATAEAFGATVLARKGPPAKALRFSDRLTAYAEFTAAQAAEARDPEETSSRLYRNAESLGADFRRRLGISELWEAFEALEFLYRQIGIEITGREGAAGRREGTGRGMPADGGPSCMTISRCFFSCFYGPDTCRLMSAFDAGIVAGLFGGATLEFTERITEGAGRCRALLRTAQRQA